MRCPHCGQEHPESTVFCPRTGQKFPDSSYCMNCGLKLQSTWKVCPKCGAQTGESRQIIISTNSWKASRILVIGSVSAIILIIITYLIYPQIEISRNTTPIAITTTAPSTETFILPDPMSQELSNNRIAFLSGSCDELEFHIYTVNDDGTELIKLTKYPIVLTDTTLSHQLGGWSNDGRVLAYASGSQKEGELKLINLESLQSTRLVDNIIPVGFFSWSPDNTHIAFVTLQNDQAEIYTIKTDKSELINLTDGLSRGSKPAWSPDNKQIAFIQTRINETGQRVYSIYTVKSNGAEQVQLIEYSSPYIPENSPPAWSPDSKRIAFAVFDTEKKIYVVDVMSIQSTNTLRIETTGLGTPYYLRWSPDGKWLYGLVHDYKQDAAGVLHLYRLDLNESGKSEWKEWIESNSYPAWSHDGKRIVFSSGDGIFVMNSDGTNLNQVISLSGCSIWPTWFK